MASIVSILSHTVILICAIAAVVILDLHGGTLDSAGIGLIGAIAGVTGTSLFNQISISPTVPTQNGNKSSPPPRPTPPAVPPAPPVA